MNKAKLLQSILELHKAVKDGNMEKTCRCAYEPGNGLVFGTSRYVATGRVRVLKAL